MALEGLLHHLHAILIQTLQLTVVVLLDLLDIVGQVLIGKDVFFEELGSALENPIGLVDVLEVGLHFLGSEVPLDLIVEVELGEGSLHALDLVLVDLDAFAVVGYSGDPFNGLVFELVGFVDEVVPIEVALEVLHDLSVEDVLLDIVLELLELGGVQQVLAGEMGDLGLGVDFQAVGCVDLVELGVIEHEQLVSVCFGLGELAVPELVVELVDGEDQLEVVGIVDFGGGLGRLKDVFDLGELSLYFEGELDHLLVESLVDVAYNLLIPRKVVLVPFEKL